MTWVAGIAALFIAAQGEAPAPAAPADTAAAAQAAPEAPQTPAPQEGTPPETPPGKTAPIRAPWEREEKDVNTVSFNVVGAAFGIYSAAFERVLTPSADITLEAGWEARSVKTGRGPVAMDGFLLGIMLRYHPFGGAPTGLYVAPELQIVNLTIIEPLGGAKGTTVGVSAEIGYSLRLFSSLFLSAGLGGAVYYGPVAPLGKLVTNWGVGPVARVNAGILF